MLKVLDWLNSAVRIINKETTDDEKSNNLIIAAEIYICSVDNNKKVTLDHFEYQGDPQSGEEQILFNYAKNEATRLLAIAKKGE